MATRCTSTGSFGCGPAVVALSAATGQEVAFSTRTWGDSVVAAGENILTTVDGSLVLSRFDGLVLNEQSAEEVERGETNLTRLDLAGGRASVVTYSPWGGGFGQDTLVTVNYAVGQADSGCEGGTPNATGVQAELSAFGSPFAGFDLNLTVTGLQPLSMLGMLVVGTQFAQPTGIPGSLGRLCVGGTVGRLTNQVQVADPTGAHRYTLSTSSVPTSAGTFAVLPGDSYTFQGWHRDQNPQGAPTSNTSTSVTVTFL